MMHFLCLVESGSLVVYITRHACEFISIDKFCDQYANPCHIKFKKWLRRQTFFVFLFDLQNSNAK